MAKVFHEVRDPIHVFIKYTSSERKVIDSIPFQRLRHINQLALSHLVYPGATHKRFEHSLGVMELATRVFDVITETRAVMPEVLELLPDLNDRERLPYWRRAVRMAALFHDVGHLPFSHTSEDLLPKGWTHDRMTVEIILGEAMKPLWKEMKLDPEDIAKLAVGPDEADHCGLDTFTTWENILGEIIAGEAFGVDRMDYLLRDSYHSGVTYGKFDHYRLIDTLRILPRPPAGPKDIAPDSSASATAGRQTREPMLGVEKGGLHSAESLLLGRYFMFQQVYLHPIRRIYDIHLKDFLKSSLPEGQFQTDVDTHLSYTDIEVTCALRAACKDQEAPGHDHADRILSRQHFKVLYEINPYDREKNDDAVAVIAAAASDRYGEENVRVDPYTKKGGASDFPVLEKDGRIVSALAESKTLAGVPSAEAGFVFIKPDLLESAKEWLCKNRDNILETQKEEEEE